MIPASITGPIFIGFLRKNLTVLPQTLEVRVTEFSVKIIINFTFDCPHTHLVLVTEPVQGFFMH